jgi:hypothetical protein
MAQANVVVNLFDLPYGQRRVIVFSENTQAIVPSNNEYDINTSYPRSPSPAAVRYAI